MALTKEGFKRETYEEIFARLEIKAKEKFGEDANTSSRVALGILLRIIAWMISIVWQEIEYVYYSAYRKTAEGKQLDALVPYAGITRNPATRASGPVQFSGTVGTFIEMGTKVTKKDETVYLTLDDAVVGTDGTVIVEVMAEEAGVSGNADIGEISEILNPIDGLDGVTNLQAITNGQELESDVELRIRADATIEGQGSGTAAAIHAGLLKISEVRAVYVDENSDDVVNAYSTPSRALQVFVLGGADEDIAQSILSEKAGGIQAFGTKYVHATDAAGNKHKIGFTRSEIVQIYARVTLTTNTSFEVDGHNQVRNAMVAYIGGLDANDITHTGLAMGEDVILAKLIARVLAVTGVEDATIELSSDGENYNQSNIMMARPQIAQMSANSIEVV